MNRYELVVVSNRGPFALDETGAITSRPAGGGLAPSLASALARPGVAPESGVLWVAAAPFATATGARAGAKKDAVASLDEDTGAIGETVEPGPDGLDLCTLAVPAELWRRAYDEIANSTLWFVHHGLFDREREPVFDASWAMAWESFRLLNAAFAKAVAARAAYGATVVVNDYHLSLLGGLLSRSRPDLSTVHFTHTAWAEPSDFAILPEAPRRELLSAMAHYGACGFHTDRWRDAFVRCLVADGIASPATFSEPLGADLKRLDRLSRSAGCLERSKRLDGLIAGRRLVLRSDRIEPSKNLLRGFLAFGELLESAPELASGVVFLARVYASRETLSRYTSYRTEVTELVAEVNRRWSSSIPRDLEGPVLLDVDDDFSGTVAALRRYDVLVVNPLRDGLNLVAKEGPALNERDGMLVLSTEAGAYAELGDSAFGVNPFDVSATASAIGTALRTGDPERSTRAAWLKAAARARTPDDWLDGVRKMARPAAT